MVTKIACLILATTCSLVAIEYEEAHPFSHKLVESADVNDEIYLDSMAEATDRSQKKNTKVIVGSDERKDESTNEKNDSEDLHRLHSHGGYDVRYGPHDYHGSHGYEDHHENYQDKGHHGFSADDYGYPHHHYVGDYSHHRKHSYDHYTSPDYNYGYHHHNSYKHAYGDHKH